MDKIRFLTAGESHGPGLTAIIEGLPAGFELNIEAINEALYRRQGGYGRGGRMKIEQDTVTFHSGLRGRITMGSPLTLTIDNKDFKHWRNIMDPVLDVESESIHLPRPGHADFAAAKKYHYDDIRNSIERSSARETAIRTAVGAICRQILDLLNIEIYSRVIQIGLVKDDTAAEKAYFLSAKESDMYCSDAQTTKQMIEIIQTHQKTGDSVGGVFQVAAFSVPVGLGSHVHWDRRLDARLSAAIVGINAIKGIEFGSGFKQAETPGSEVHDPFTLNDNRIGRSSNHAGGIEGGISNGMPIIFQAVMKPIPTLAKPLDSVNLHTLEIEKAHKERTDSCAVPAAAVVAENVTAIVLLDEILNKFGGDSKEELLTRYKREAILL